MSHCDPLPLNANKNDICILKHHARISFEIIFLILVSMNGEMCEKALTHVNYSKIIQLDKFRRRHILNSFIAIHD